MMLKSHDNTVTFGLNTKISNLKQFNGYHHNTKLNSSLVIQTNIALMFNCKK